jgi:hypothetical protein
MRLICYTTSGAPPNIIPAPVERAWMDQTPDGHAYRCLPLNIANAHGWMLLNTVPFTAEWNGRPELNSITVRPLAAGDVLGQSHFGSGVLTFHVNGLFRTEPGYDLMVSGPINMLKDAIQPLTGVVETDWAPFTFTMNWKFTRPGTQVTFARDEPFCMIYPVRRGLIEDIEPEIRPIESDADINSAFTAWGESRRGFNKELRVPGSEARARKWQKDYFRGDSPFAEGPPDHRTKLRAKPFTVVRPWRRASLLDQFAQEQTDANRVGRQRLRDGVLRPSPNTVRVTPDKDFELDALDFVCQPNFLTTAEIALLADAAGALTRPGPRSAETAGIGHAESAIDDQARDDQARDDQVRDDQVRDDQVRDDQVRDDQVRDDQVRDDQVRDDQVRDWVALFSDVARQRPDAAALMRDIQRRITEQLGRFYELTLPLYTDSVHLIRLVEGLWLDPHAARAHADGSPHPTEHRDFASIIYLNDDYAGGEVYFPRLDLVVKPAAGMLLAFTGGWHHEHAVTEVTHGDQLTLAAFHTFDSRLRDSDLMVPDGQAD